MEQLDLTSPVVPPAITAYRVVRLVLDWPEAFIRIDVRGLNGENKTHEYTGATATTLMRQLNTLNLSTTSLHKRLLTRLVADGVFAGTVTGSPD